MFDNNNNYYHYMSTPPFGEPSYPEPTKPEWDEAHKENKARNTTQEFLDLRDKVSQKVSEWYAKLEKRTPSTTDLLPQKPDMDHPTTFLIHEGEKQYRFLWVPIIDSPKGVGFLVSPEGIAHDATLAVFSDSSKITLEVNPLSHRDKDDNRYKLTPNIDPDATAVSFHETGKLNVIRMPYPTYSNLGNLHTKSIDHADKDQPILVVTPKDIADAKSTLEILTLHYDDPDL
ncbi:MAG: hypothetical protein UU93_C0004G0027 [Candidatus Amesbacteria bacterium GW2011_GWA2_42_12]|uniref:Uncharacterized protein n=1 Tax=Candidatus Amesbacteria bacterium GW2011_GWA2_42_12 TaxID=1618356 RepID=A0A0G0Y8F2_9BACT|nr:MAG: hypothetical protein UU93_C0004G0027 [Candidatus Amesbacteria bacterium GW2011_GWA2_42_12]